MFETSAVAQGDTQRRSGRFVGRLLVAGGVLALVIPVPYDSLQGVGTSDYRTLDAAGYEHALAVTTTDTPRLHHQDDILGAVMRSNQAATRNEHAADRRLLALVLIAPGAFLLGRHPRTG